MKTKEEILKRNTEAIAKCSVKYNVTHQGILNAMEEYATQCQQDMADRKEIQPEDIWNKESQDKIKEHIKSVSKNQSSEEILETELMAKKYTEEDLIKAIAYGQTTKQIDYHKDFINSLNKQDNEKHTHIINRQTK
jgi:lambda repressor-like predicted transcriptional regulator